MTSHGLLRCSTERLLAQATERHGAGAYRVDAELRWRSRERVAGSSTCWRTRLPDGSVVGWCLEVEQGANGVLAHLSAAVVTGRLTRLPRTVQRVALRRWTEHELGMLTRAVEVGPAAARTRETGPVGGASRSGDSSS